MTAVRLTGRSSPGGDTRGCTRGGPWQLTKAGHAGCEDGGRDVQVEVGLVGDRDDEEAYAGGHTEPGGVDAGGQEEGGVQEGAGQGPVLLLQPASGARQALMGGPYMLLEKRHSPPCVRPAQ